MVLIALLALSISTVSATNSDALSSDLSLFENKYFGRTFTDDSTEQRLDRIERMVYGSRRKGSIKQRVTRLLLDVPELNSTATTTASTYPPVAPPIQETGNQVQPENTEVPDNEDYPAVDALEKEILGKTSRKLPIQQRLSDMERKAFGAPSDVQDLSKRVEILEQYVASKNGNNEDYLSTPEQSIKWTSHQRSLTDQVAALEERVFGKTYSQDNLVSRVGRLERSVCPLDAQQTFTPLPQRISRLQSALNPVHYAGSQELASQPHHHPLLHKMAKILGGAATIAGEAVGSAVAAGSYMGYGGYGYGMGFPGYGYGYPGFYPGRFMGMY